MFLRSSSDTYATPPLSTGLSSPRFTARAAAMRAASATVLAEEEEDAVDTLAVGVTPATASPRPPREPVVDGAADADDPLGLNPSSSPGSPRTPDTNAGPALPPPATHIVAPMVTSAPGSKTPAGGSSSIQPGDTAASPGEPPPAGTKRQLATTSPTLTSLNEHVLGSAYRNSPTSTTGFSSVHLGCDAIS